MSTASNVKDEPSELLIWDDKFRVAFCFLLPAPRLLPSPGPVPGSFPSEPGSRFVAPGETAVLFEAAFLTFSLSMPRLLPPVNSSLFDNRVVFGSESSATAEFMAAAARERDLPTDGVLPLEVRAVCGLDEVQSISVVSLPSACMISSLSGNLLRQTGVNRIMSINTGAKNQTRSQNPYPKSGFLVNFCTKEVTARPTSA